MISFTLKSTGETFVLPTPGNGQTKIDELLPNQPLTEKEINNYFNFRELFKRKH